VLESESSDHRLEINHYAGQAFAVGDQIDHMAFEVENLNEAHFRGHTFRKGAPKFRIGSPMPLPLR